MKPILLAAVLTALLPGILLAQAGVVCLFADPDGVDCGLRDDAPGLMQVYVLHLYSGGATAIEFSAPMPPCMLGATWISDTATFPITLGDSQTGVSVAYGSCLGVFIHALTINYAVAGLTSADCAYPVLPNPNSGSVHTNDSPSMPNNVVVRTFQGSPEATCVMSKMAIIKNPGNKMPVAPSTVKNICIRW